jgi:hypothetical protein
MLALTSLLAACLCVSPDAGRIAGRVVDVRTGAGLSAARVTLDEKQAATTADEEGRFEFPDVAEGFHTVSAAVPGFASSAPVRVLVISGGQADVEIPYSLGLSTDVHAAGEPGGEAETPALARASLRGRDVASAVGGLDDVGRVLQFHPGIAASQDDRNDLIVRGGGALETQVVADGFELPTASHFGASGSASGGISLIPSEVIGRVSVAMGGFSAAYGERASSLVQIDLPAGETRPVAGAVSAGAGGVLALGRGAVGRGGSWLGSVRRSILETAFSRGNTSAVPRYRDLFGRLTVPLGAAHDLRVLLIGASDSADVESVQSTRLSAIRDEQTLALAGIGLRSRWGEWTSSSLAVSFSVNETDAYSSNAGVVDGRELSREGELRVRAEVQRAVSRRLAVTLGAAFRRTAASFDLQGGAYRNEYGIYVPALKTSWHDRVPEAAGYVEAAATLAPGLRAVAGLRAERPGTSRDWRATPRLRVEYDAARGVRLSGSWGVYRQAVPLVWIASWEGNRNLSPIRCAMGTLGAAVSGPWGLRLSAEAFLKRYQGYPVDPAEPPRVLVSAGGDFDVPFVGHLLGAGSVHGSGVDAIVSRTFGPRGEIAASYSHWRVAQRGLDLEWRPGDYDIRHQARTMATWRPSLTWTVSASWRYASGRPYTPFDPAASIKAGGGRYDRARTNALRYGAYERLDVRVERLFAPGRTVLTVFAEVMNLTDHDNIYVYTWSRSTRRPDPVLQWGRTPVAGLRLEF